jgi:hypothetical protein
MSKIIVTTISVVSSAEGACDGAGVKVVGNGVVVGDMVGIRVEVGAELGALLCRTRSIVTLVIEQTKKR